MKVPSFIPRCGFFLLAITAVHAGSEVATPKELVSSPSEPVVSTADARPNSASDKDFADTLREYLTVGSFDIHPLLRVESMYDDNIFISNRTTALPAGANTRHDFITTVTPGAFVGSGDYSDKIESYFGLTYLPTLYFFENNPKLDTLEHDALLEGQYKASKLTLKLSQAYQKLDSASVDVGNRTSRDIYETRFGAEYEVSDKTSIDLSGVYTARVYKISANSNEWSGALFVNYQILPKIKLGVGATGGYLDISDTRPAIPLQKYTPNQSYEGGLIRAVWDPTPKLSFRTEVGAQVRHFDPQLVGDRTLPVFTLAGKWQPFNHTDILIKGYRREDYSNSSRGQNYVCTGLQIDLQQRFFQKLVAELVGIYEKCEYQNITNPTAFERDEDYFSISPSLKWEFNKYFDAKIYYRYRENDSNSVFNTFENNQYGIALGAKF